MEKKNSKRSEGSASRRSRPFVFAPFVAVALALSGCATLAPQQRAILADPTMQFDAEAKHDAALRHAIDNREGSMGGTGVSGGGCGCN
jgi:Domain of unknown function (DUF4266)